MQHLTSDLQGTPSSKSYGQMTAIQELQYALNNWGSDMTLTNQEPAQSPSLPSTKDKWDKRRSPRVQPPDPRVQLPDPRVHSPSLAVRPQSLRVPTEPNTQPVAKQTRSRTAPTEKLPATRLAQPIAHRNRSQNIQEGLSVHPAQAVQRKYPWQLLEVWCTPVPSELESMPVLGEESGKTLESRQMLIHPKYRNIWITLYAN